MVLYWGSPLGLSWPQIHKRPKADIVSSFKLQVQLYTAVTWEYF
jgi:hypothetical protein